MDVVVAVVVDDFCAGVLTHRTGMGLCIAVFNSF